MFSFQHVGKRRHHRLQYATDVGADLELHMSRQVFTHQQQAPGNQTGKIGGTTVDGQIRPSPEIPGTTRRTGTPSLKQSIDHVPRNSLSSLQLSKLISKTDMPEGQSRTATCYAHANRTHLAQEECLGRVLNAMSRQVLGVQQPEHASIE